MPRKKLHDDETACASMIKIFHHINIGPAKHFVTYIFIKFFCF